MSHPPSSLVFHNVARHALASRASGSCVSATGHVARRFFASSHSVLASKVDDASGSGIVNLGARSAGRIAAKDENGNAIGREPGPLYREWLELDGAAFKDPRPHETNYLGGRVPFPLNPSFKPPAPLSDRLRDLIFREWMRDPEKNTPRALSLRHGISIKRVEAIIRLKTHEYKWKQEGKPLQTAFANAFESATGVYANVSPHKMKTKTPPELMERDNFGTPREDAAAADYDADWEQLPEQGISRVYWEMVDEGDSPIVPAKLDEVAEKKLAAARTQSASASSKTVGKTTFVDIGDKFAHSHADVKRTDPRYRGPLWKPSFSV